MGVKREREIAKQVYFSEEEWAKVEQNMEQVGAKNFSQYARKICADGYIIKKDFDDIRALTKELANLARSINQIAKRANETRSIYEADIHDLQYLYGQVKSKISERLVKMIRE